MEQLAEAVQELTGETVELAYVDQGYTGENAAQAAAKHGIRLEVIKHTEAKRGLCTAAAKMGGRTMLRLGRSLPAGWPAITNGSLKPWQGSTTWPSPVSCSLPLCKMLYPS